MLSIIRGFGKLPAPRRYRYQIYPEISALTQDWKYYRQSTDLVVAVYFLSRVSIHFQGHPMCRHHRPAKHHRGYIREHQLLHG